MSKIIGRIKEIQILDDILKSNYSEFLAIYGRRRVGKTHLTRNYFDSKGVYFEITGQKDASLQVQLENFTKSMEEVFFPGAFLQPPKSWNAAFTWLNSQINNLPAKKPVILFFDELPWLAKKKSGIIQALDFHWNRYWSQKNNIKLIVCGSAASWMLEKLVNAKGGLHNRLTKTIHLEPFCLGETRQYLKNRKIDLNDKQILELYMVMGGIPHYLNQVKSGKSATQNIHNICFENNGLLFREYSNLFPSLFDNHEVHVKIISEISKHRNGISRSKLLKACKIDSGGTFNKRMAELESSGFVVKYVPFRKSRRDSYYKIIDEYTLFYLKWIKNTTRPSKNYWKEKSHEPGWKSWAGYAFEAVCLKHIHQIQHALKFDGLGCETGSWQYIPSPGSKDKGTQIDLLFDRSDNAISICEIKHSNTTFTIDKSYADILTNKLRVFETYFPTNKQLFLEMITTHGIKHNFRSRELVSNEIKLEDLFKEII